MHLLALLKSTAVIALLGLASFGIGAAVAPRLRLRTEDRLERCVWEAALGLLSASVLLGWLGQVGGLHRGAIVCGTCISALVGCGHLWNRLREPRSSAATTREVTHEPSRWVLTGLGVCAAAATAAAFFSALVPPTAGDALTYHLELPKRFLQAGGLTFSPDDDNCVYPLTAEMGFLWALAFGDVAATSLVHWAYGLLSAGATYVLAKPAVGAHWARAAACLALMTPGVNNQMTAPLNDVAMTAYFALAIAAWMRAQREESTSGFVLVGLMVGGAIGMKYTGLVLAASMAAAWLIAAMTDVGRRRTLLLGFTQAAVAAIVVAGLWYGRAAWHRGDPVYPFLSRGGEATERSAFPETKAPLGRGPAALVAAPWLLTMEPARFGGRAHQLGPLFLMFVPCLLLLPRTPAVTSPLLIAGLYGCVCLLLRQNVRFLLPIVPVLATAVVAVWREIMTWPRGPRHLVVAATIGVTLFLTAIPVARLRHTADALLGRETLTAYLARSEPTFAIAEWINTQLPSNSRILSQEQRTFYLQPATTRESLYRRRTQYDRRLQAAEDLGDWLRCDGFTHVLTAESTGSPGVDYDATLSRLVESAAAEDATRAPTVVQQWRHVDPLGTARHYRLWELR